MNLRTAAVFAAAAACCSVPARADTYTVTSLFDSGLGSLRSAVADANSHPGADTIMFNPALSGVIALESPLYINESVQIIGRGPAHITLDLSAAGIGLYIQNPTTDVGLIDLEAVNGSSFLFASVNKLRLNVQRCVFRDIGVTGVLQAGVFNPNWLDRTLIGSVQSCSFINNHGVHGGVFITNPDPAGEWLDFVNCTFVGNESSNGGGVAWLWGSGPGAGGASFTSCTVTGNNGGQAGMPMGAIHIATGAVDPDWPTCRVKNCVVAENSAGAPVADANFTGLSPAATSLQGNNILADPGLSALRYVNGAYVRTPQSGSPCIDAAASDSSVRYDQVGNHRPQVAAGVTLPAGSDGADIGAVEVVPGGCAADFNGSGSVTVQDIFDFLGAYFAGCGI